jgi:hypothetical protein
MYGTLFIGQTHDDIRSVQYRVRQRRRPGGIRVAVAVSATTAAVSATAAAAPVE